MSEQTEELVDDVAKAMMRNDGSYLRMARAAVDEVHRQCGAVIDERAFKLGAIMAAVDDIHMTDGEIIRKIREIVGGRT